MQSYFRSLRPPLDPDSVLMLGIGDGGLGAATLFSREEADWSRVHFRGIAVAIRLRRQGGAHAREALNVAFAQMQGLAHESGATEQFVLLRVDPANAPSRTLAAEAGFSHSANDGPYEVWTILTPV